MCDEPQFRLAEQIGMRGPNGLTGMTAALGKDHLRARVVHENPQEFSGSVASSPHNPHFNLSVGSHLQFFFKFLTFILMGGVIDPQRG